MLTLWEPPTGHILHTISAYTESVSGVALSPDGRMVLVGTADNSLKLFDLAAGEEVETLACGSLVTSVAFSPDGRMALGATRTERLSFGTWRAARNLARSWGTSPR